MNTMGFYITLNCNRAMTCDISLYALTSTVYEPQFWTSENGNFIDCTQGRTDDDIEKVCEFKLDNLRPCIKEDDYGFGDGQPCIILKLNKVNIRLKLTV